MTPTPLNSDQDYVRDPATRQAENALETSEPTPLLDLLLLLADRKRLILLGTLSGALLGLILALWLKPVYTATATIMPPQAPQSSLSSMLGQLGGLGALGGGASSLLKNPSDLYVGILQSRTISDRAIDQFHLRELWKVKTMTTARKKLASHTQFELEKSGLIEISVAEHNPQLASDLANFFVDALHHMNSALAISEAGQRRVFFEQQIEEEKGALSAAEEELKRTQQKTGLLTVPGQTELAIRNIAQTRAQISSLEVQLQGLLSYATEENSEVQQIRNQLRTLREQLSQQENSQGQPPPGDTAIAANQVPAGSLDYLRKLRDVKYHEALFDLLSRQYEAARIDEAKSAPIIQVVDRALPPDQKSGPPRALITLSAGVAGFLFTCGYVLARAWSYKRLEDSRIGSKVDQLWRILHRGATTIASRTPEQSDAKA